MSEAKGFVGTTVAGKYKLRRLIGVGGMGSVYEGQHIDLGKKVAVKIIDSGNDMSPELATRFKREARAASAVESENIVQVFDVGRDAEVGLYMVMELLQGEDLEMRLRKQPGRRLDAVAVAQIGYQSARALVKAHAARVIHRDLKPANLFLTEREDGNLRVKILDFGISKLLGSSASIASADGILELTAAGVALGTPQYMSPEQAQGLTTVNHRSDVWGLGVVLYEALAGVPAYPELGTYQETILKILTDRPPPLAKIAPWVPEALARVVHEAVEHDVDKRIADCSVLAERIATAVPEAVMGVTGGWRPRMGSSANLIDPSFARESVLPNSRPITLGDDTQVVVRPSDPASHLDEDMPSKTMFAADLVPSTRREQPKVIVHEGVTPSARGQEPEPDPLSAGDPTMFQSPAWVNVPGNDGPTTMKSLALGDPKPRLSKPMQPMMSATLTALGVFLFGVLVLAITRSSGATDATPGSSSDRPSDPSTQTASPSVGESQAQEPAPPATGTAQAPAPPSEVTAVAPATDVSAPDAGARADAMR